MKLRYFKHDDLRQMLRVYVGTVRALKHLGVKDEFIARMTSTKTDDIQWALTENKFDVNSEDKSDINKNTQFLYKALKESLESVDK